MNNVSTWKCFAEEIRKLVANGLTEEAIKRLLSISPRKVQEQATLLSAQLNRLQDRLISGTSTLEQLRADQTRIDESVLLLASGLAGRSDSSEAPVEPPDILEPGSLGFPPLGQLEKVVTSSRNVHPIAWLAEGLEAAKGICRVTRHGGNGTGFVIHSNFLMTCHHVLPTRELAQEAIAQFGYEVDKDGNLQEPSTNNYRLNPEAFWQTNPELDYTIVAIDTTSGSQTLDYWGSLRVDSSVPIYAGDTVVIVQHPDGGPKKIAIGTNHVVGLLDFKLFYLTDTLPGSSGAPVFNDDWSVIAIHYRGGKMPINPRGDNRYVNAGVLMSAVKSNMGDGWPGD